MNKPYIGTNVQFTEKGTGKVLAGIVTNVWTNGLVDLALFTSTGFIFAQKIEQSTTPAGNEASVGKWSNLPTV